MFQVMSILTVGRIYQDYDTWKRKMMRSSENGEMLNKRRVYIFGNSLLTAGILSVLEEDQQFIVLGCVATVEETQLALHNQVTDALIVIDTDDQTAMRLCPVLAQDPDLPILRADISQDYIRIETSQNIEADPENLLAALAALPRRA